jgi:hypothetical protein
MKIKYREQVAGAPLPCLAATREVEAVLLPCPKCRVDGEQLLVVKVFADPWELDEETVKGQWAVECGNCGIVLPGFPTAALVVEAWNDRTDLAWHNRTEQR